MLEIEYPQEQKKDFFPNINKKNLMWNLYIGFFITSLGESVLGPVYPEEANKRGISEFVIGLIMGVHPLFSILSALWMGKKLGEESRKILMIIGSVMQGFGYLILCLIYFIPQNEKILFILLSGLGRILSGVGVTLYQNPCYSMISFIFKEDYHIKIGYLEMLIGQGLVLGFVQGSFLYYLGGYTLPFMMSSIISLLLIPLTCKNIPSHDEIHDPLIRFENLIKSGNAQLSDSLYKVQYSTFMKDSRIILTFFAAMLPTTAILFLQPTFALYLDKTLSISPDYSGYIFGTSEITYIIFCPVLAKAQNYVSRKKIIGYGIFFFAIVYLFQGPAEYLPIQPSIAQCIVIRLLSGMIQPASFVTAIPEFIEIIEEIDNNYSEEQIGDIASAFFNSAWHLGEVIGPILGGAITAEYGFIWASNFFAYVMALFSFIYFFRFYFYEKYFNSKNPNNSETSKILKNQLNINRESIQTNSSSYSSQNDEI